MILSAGSDFAISRATVSPPKPESNMPMGEVAEEVIGEVALDAPNSLVVPAPASLEALFAKLLIVHRL